MTSSFEKWGVSVLLAGTILSVPAFAAPPAANTATAKALTPATAQNVGMTAQDVGVLDQPRPGYDAKGIPMGGFRLFPTLDINGTYDDNVFRQPEGVDDYSLAVTPNVYLRSDWGRHFVELYAGTESYFYADHSNENLTDWKYGADGRYDIARGANMTLNANYGEKHEDWQTPDTETGYQSKPNRYFLTHTDMSLTDHPNRLGVTAGVKFDRYVYRKTPLNGGGFQANGDRDRNIVEAYGKLGYDFSPGYSGFIRGTYNVHDYDAYYDRSGYHRSSHGFVIDGGVDLQVTHLVSGEVFAGYHKQDYSHQADASLNNFSGLNYGVNLDWYAAPVLTVHLTGQSSVSDVTVSGASGADNKTINLSADYELLRNVIVQGNVGYMHTKYIGMSRVYRYPKAGLDVKWLMNRYLALDLSYKYSKRTANIADADYTDNLVSLTLKSHI